MAKRSTPERDFQDALVEHARKKGWMVMAVDPARVRNKRTVTPFRYDGVGWPDLTCVKDNRLVFIECKAKGIRALRPEQQKWQLALIGLERDNFGVEYHILNPIDWDLIERIFA